MSATVIANLIDLAKTSNMNNKHAAAITYGKRVVASATNWSLWGSSHNSSWKSWDTLQTYVRCPSKLLHQC